MGKQVYLDNASTAFPKAPGVAEAMRYFLEEIGCNVARGGYSGAYTAADEVIDTRERLCRLFNFKDAKNVVFTSNVTHSLNLVIKGFLKAGDHVLVTSMEHNAIMRPLVQLESIGVSFSRMPCGSDGVLFIDQIEPLIKPNTKAIIMLHASNVCGAVMPALKVGELAKRYGFKFILDAAQTAGVLDVDMQSLNLDALAFTGHKSLLGPQGIGGLILTDEMARETMPLLSGGTGSISDSELVPEFMPDRFEAGTLNLPGIYGLNAALKYLEKTGIKAIRDRERELAARLCGAVGTLDAARIIGPDDRLEAMPIVSVDFPAYDNAEISQLLAEDYGVLTRCGLHCAPNAHKTLGTFPYGTVRFSVSHFNTEEEIDFAAEALKKVLAKAERLV